MSIDPTSLGPNWWTSLTHGGLLIAPAMVEKAFGDDFEPLPTWRAEALRRAVTRRAETGVRTLLDTVFTQVLGYDSARWNRNPPAEQWSRRLITGDTERPDRLYIGGDGAQSGLVFPIFTEKPDIRLGYHRGRRAVARVVEWLRKSDLKVALLATEQQWRLIYAGSDFEAWCEWNLDLWFEAGQPALQVEALRRLLDPATVPVRLLDAIQDSRRGQSELTSVLGERVRQAVEKLIQSSAANLEGLNVLPSDIYLAATRMIMRCVVGLFAEGKGMLGRDMPAYHDSYGLQGLREQLERVSLGRPEILIEEPHFAWPRLISLFRLIHSGSSHPQLTTTRYGGTLFEAGDLLSADPVLRAVAAFESTHPCPRDRDVYEMLLLLTRTFVKVSQGRGARAVPTPVDFSSLDTEYIGILYEGLLDYDLKRADEPVVFLRMGDEPALRVSDLEAIPPNKLRDVFGKLQKKTELSVSESDDGEDADGPGNDSESPDVDAEDLDDMENELTPDAADSASEVAASDAGIERARRWAVDAVRASGRVRVPRRQTDQARSQYEEEVAKEARNLFSRIVRTGDWYLVRFGNTRKGSGTFYTRKELASPTVRRTLAPLLRNETGAPRAPEEILAVKVCDPAVGSGSFLISALRYITEALYDSLYQHDRLYTSGANRCYKLSIVPDECLPDAEDFEDRLRARLRRHVVERCLYGVDLNPLAIELARMSLWIETLDPRLPFGFLDHKLKAGNSLVGCWFDRFEDYPIMAWLREGGDKDYQPVNSRANWTKAITAELRDRVKPGMVRVIGAGAQQHLPLAEGKVPAEIYQGALAHLDAIHSLSLTEPERQREEYRKLRENPAFQRLRLAFDFWCALWFWPGDQLRTAPIVTDFLQPSAEAVGITAELHERLRFFHWELEYPDVFTKPGAGFSAIVGNPPWETQKPNSLEFFSNIDPLYRTYGKQEALRQQRTYFRTNPNHESNWMAERARLKALSNWVKYAGSPFGDRVTQNKQGRLEFDLGLGSRFAISKDLHERWKVLRGDRIGYADPDHPFSIQGSADLNTYKMFLELAVKVGVSGSHIGMLVPAGIYSDFGAKVLRTYLLSACRWEHLYCFQNERFVFDRIHHSFKITTLHFKKGGSTDSLKTRFRLGPAQSPTVAEIEDDITSGAYLPVPAAQIAHFSGSSAAILEIRSEQDLKLIEKLYSNGVSVGDQNEYGWNVQYATEFHTTNDSELFPPRPEWEARGYRADEYGHWLKGGWSPYNGSKNILRRAQELVLSADGLSAIHLPDIEDVALPLYEGRMIGQFDFSQKGWVSGKGRTAVWQEETWPRKRIRPQYLMGYSTWLASEKSYPFPKLPYMRVSASTNTRTTICGYFGIRPAVDSIFFYRSGRRSIQDIVILTGILNSFVFDFQMRLRLGGINLSAFVVGENSLPRHDLPGVSALLDFSTSLSLPDISFASEWESLRPPAKAWKHSWAITSSERLRCRCILDALAAHCYGLSLEELRFILRDSHHPTVRLAQSSFTRNLDPKGFWRVDRNQQPHFRQTVLSLVAFQELKRIGLDAFLALNDGEGWMLPETLRLADYDLRDDDRANEHQPVASVLGPRFYAWQLSQSVEESWEECGRHAELLAKIVPPPVQGEEESPESAADPSPDEPQVNLFGEPLPADLFGNPEYPRRRR